ncbi:MAG TPA: LysE family transporter [Flavisolibacter sp.]|jgi:threonine/homoserine/homoserine lactone efflux protein|nr:LysE family transporter [Flavisolibacter sp.]
MINALIKGVTLGLLLAISVGPIVFTVIKQSLSNGRKGGFAFIAGISCSDILLVIFSNLFTNLFSILNAHKKSLAVVASIFLIIIGVYYLFFKKAKLKKEESGRIYNTKSYLRVFVTGFIMNIFNPGIIVFWLTTATTFIDHTLNERLLIFGTALFLALAADVAKVLLADKIRKNLTPKNIHLINRINGLILIGFGVVIIILQR